MADPILDLTTLVERPKIAIDGEFYDIVSPDELSILDSHRLGRLGHRLDALMSKEAHTPEEEAELDAVLRELGDRIMVGVPDDVRAKLNNQHFLTVVEVFIALQRRQRAAALKTIARLIGASSSPGFNGSTAAIPTGGSGAPPPASSAPSSK